MLETIILLHLRSEELACCCDDTFVEVLDINRDFSSVYKNARHTDFVRGLAWYKDDLLSCSWDNTVLKHTIHSCDRSYFNQRLKKKKQYKSIKKVLYQQIK